MASTGIPIMQYSKVGALGAAVALAIVAYVLLDPGHPGSEVEQGDLLSEVHAGPSQGLPVQAQQPHEPYPQSGPGPAALAPPSSTAPSVETLQAELAGLRRDLADLRETVAALTRDVQRLSFTLLDADTGDLDEPSRYEDALAEENWRRREEYRVQENAFQREPVDSAWSATTLGEIETVLQSLGASEQVQTLECRASTCRIEIRGLESQGEGDPAGGSFSKRVPELVLRLGTVLPSMTAFEVESGSDVPSTVFYFSRNVDPVQ